MVSPSSVFVSNVSSALMRVSPSGNLEHAIEIFWLSVGSRNVDFFVFFFFGFLFLAPGLRFFFGLGLGGLGRKSSMTPSTGMSSSTATRQTPACRRRRPPDRCASKDSAKCLSEKSAYFFFQRISFVLSGAFFLCLRFLGLVVLAPELLDPLKHPERVRQVRSPRPPPLLAEVVVHADQKHLLRLGLLPLPPQQRGPSASANIFPTARLMWCLLMRSRPSPTSRPLNAWMLRAATVALMKAPWRTFGAKVLPQLDGRHLGDLDAVLPGHHHAARHAAQARVVGLHRRGEDLVHKVSFGGEAEEQVPRGDAAPLLVLPLDVLQDLLHLGPGHPLPAHRLRTGLHLENGGLELLEPVALAEARRPLFHLALAEPGRPVPVALAPARLAEEVPDVARHLRDKGRLIRARLRRAGLREPDQPVRLRLVQPELRGRLPDRALGLRLRTAPRRAATLTARRHSETEISATSRRLRPMAATAARACATASGAAPPSAIDAASSCAATRATARRARASAPGQDHALGQPTEVLAARAVPQRSTTARVPARAIIDARAGSAPAAIAACREARAVSSGPRPRRCQLGRDAGLGRLRRQPDRDVAVRPPGRRPEHNRRDGLAEDHGYLRRVPRHSRAQLAGRVDRAQNLQRLRVGRPRRAATADAIADTDSASASAPSAAVTRPPPRVGRADGEAARPSRPARPAPRPGPRAPPPSRRHLAAAARRPAGRGRPPPAPPRPPPPAARPRHRGLHRVRREADGLRRRDLGLRRLADPRRGLHAQQPRRLGVEALDPSRLLGRPHGPQRGGGGVGALTRVRAGVERRARRAPRRLLRPGQAQPLAVRPADGAEAADGRARRRPRRRLHPDAGLRGAARAGKVGHRLGRASGRAAAPPTRASRRPGHAAHRQQASRGTRAVCAPKRPDAGPARPAEPGPKSPPTPDDGERAETNREGPTRSSTSATSRCRGSCSSRMSASVASGRSPEKSLRITAAVSGMSSAHCFSFLSIGAGTVTVAAPAPPLDICAKRLIVAAASAISPDV